MLQCHTGFLKTYPLIKNVQMTFCVTIGIWMPSPKNEEIVNDMVEVDTADFLKEIVFH